MIIHPGKTKVMIISKRKFIGPLQNITINGRNLEIVDHQKVLGTTIDDSLLWRVQIDRNEKHYRTEIKMLKRMFILGSAVMSKFYFATIIPSVAYNIAVWGNNNAILKKLEILHVRAAKKIFQLPDHLSDDDVLKAAGWMSIEYLYKRRLLCLMHKIFYRNIDSELSNMVYILNSNSTPQRRDNQVKIANQFRSTNQNTFVVRASTRYGMQCQMSLRVYQNLTFLEAN